MRISAKGRYALSAMIEIAAQNNEGKMASALSVARTLGISKIYLEQALSLLKKGRLVNVLKGSKGGYELTRSPEKITVLDVLKTVENSLIEKTGDTVSEHAPTVESALRQMVFDPLDQAIETCLGSITIQSLLDYTRRQQAEQAFMLNM